MLSGVFAASVQEDPAIERASAYLLSQSQEQFAEVRHRMKFSRAAGFTCTDEEQSGDIFARATLAHLLLDIAEGLGPGLRHSFMAIARREADYVASTKLQNRAGGWS